ncbi:MAG: ATP-dependent sacrificial sulfur transferase LarE [Tissierellia bacterium]|nr:ATP-dependent sacrificial sulfur transferase LarE [Tissierellia bacterium]
MDKLLTLREYLNEYKKIAIAYSGGVDSTFLMKFATEILGKDNVLGINISSSLQTKRERSLLIDLNANENFNVVSQLIDELNIPGLVENTSNRCYYCKKAIFENIFSIANKHGYKYVFDGTNADDIDDFRPGMKALRELGVISPLKECGLNKDDIRKYSKDLNLITHDIPSSACIASRIPYETKITKENLKQVELAEDLLFQLGYTGFRVRYHDSIARIELKEQDMIPFIENHRVEVYESFKRIGFTFVTLDIIGYRMGSQNELLSEKEKGEVNYHE